MFLCGGDICSQVQKWALDFFGAGETDSCVSVIIGTGNPGTQLGSSRRTLTNKSSLQITRTNKQKKTAILLNFSLYVTGTSRNFQ